MREPGPGDRAKTESGMTGALVGAAPLPTLGTDGFFVTLIEKTN
jgi:hypothetical protein